MAETPYNEFSVSATVAGAQPPTWAPAQLGVLAICFVINMLDGMDVLILSYVAPAISRDWAISPERLGALLSAGFAGMAFGGIVIAPLADRIGRRPIILAALASSSLGMVLSGLAGDLSTLLALRVLIGIGIGCILATMAALVGEYAPPGRESFAVGFLQAGWPIGATITGFIAASTIPRFGWAATLSGAGLVSALMIVPTWRLLPESSQFLLRARPPRALERLNAIRARFGQPALEDMPTWGPDLAPRGSIQGLFAKGRGQNTLLIWPAIILGFVTLYFVLTWLPKLATMAGLAPADAIYATAVLNIGAFLGTTAISWLSTRAPLQWLVPGFFLVAAVVLLVFGNFTLPLAAVLVAACAIGFFLQGGFNGLYPLVAAAYPPELRSTGLGWATGLGRIGAVAGPLAAGFLVGRSTPLGVIFAVFCVPMLIAGVFAHFVRADRSTTAP